MPQPAQCWSPPPGAHRRRWLTISWEIEPLVTTRRSAARKPRRTSGLRGTLFLPSTAPVRSPSSGGPVHARKPQRPFSSDGRGRRESRKIADCRFCKRGGRGSLASHQAGRLAALSGPVRREPTGLGRVQLDLTPSDSVSGTRAGTLNDAVGTIVNAPRLDYD